MTQHHDKQGAKPTLTNRDRFFYGEPFYSMTGEELQYDKSNANTRGKAIEFININGKFFANIKSINRSSFTILIPGIKKIMEETIEFHTLKFIKEEKAND
jgi:hypothetical protein